MADPLTVACGAAQFIGLAGQALEGMQFIRSLFHGIKTAPKLIKRLHHELKAFESVLAQLANLEVDDEVDDEIAQGFITTLVGCADIYDGLYEQVRKYDFDCVEDDRTLKRLWNQVLANDNRPRFEDYLRRLERAKSSLLASMSALQLQRTRYDQPATAHGYSSSMLTSSSNIKDDLTSNAKQIEHSFTRVETDLSRMEATLDRTETGITSITMMSERTYTSSLETKDSVQALTNAMRSIDSSLRNMRADLPQMIEEGVQRCLEDRLTDWKNNWERSQSTKGSRLSLGDEPRSSAIEAPALLPRSTISRRVRQHPGTAFARKKTYARNIPFPFGFIQTKATRKIVHEVTDSGLIVEKEILRMEVSVLPFRWLSTKGHYLSVQKFFDQNKSPSWNMTLRTYHVVPEDSMIMLACENRDLDAIRKLFEYRKASPFDVDSNGSSLLVHAIARFTDAATPDDMVATREVISFLTSHGADPTGFFGHLLDRHMHHSRDTWLWDHKSAAPTADRLIHQAIDDIWSLCLDRCHADPFADIGVLKKVWETSMGGRMVPPLDPSYLFHDRYSGLDDLVFEHPDQVFWDLMNARIGSVGPDEIWERLIDQQYETLVYLCNGGKDSIKANIFSRQYAATVTWRRENSCYCPSNGTHLLYQLLDDLELEKSSYWLSRKKPMLQHLKRMLILLLQNGEDPKATCSCPARWQRKEYFRSPTDIAAEQGVLAIWIQALEECGIDSGKMIEDWQYDGISSLFGQDLKGPGAVSSGTQTTPKRCFPTSVAFFTALLSTISALSCWLLWIRFSS
ncbi:hypothetical protein BDV96DRAFT_648428 [Lophiotrema nucula]|uniref:Fungal N-terminal domain-containing protein n=1 Tax=Lophiotrema nucula TaxID=690887 RepID=A0A6A5Z241_9PLEO|nr:hypothetical protein BDV96DRAFT_648428 [Lophiotrema nucula]